MEDKQEKGYTQSYRHTNTKTYAGWMETLTNKRYERRLDVRTLLDTDEDWQRANKDKRVDEKNPVVQHQVNVTHPGRQVNVLL